ncbi:MAG: hypothetical protein ABIQ90_05525 [Polaromonas sp.]
MNPKSSKSSELADLSVDPLHARKTGNLRLPEGPAALRNLPARQDLKEVLAP